MAMIERTIECGRCKKKFKVRRNPVIAERPITCPYCHRRGRSPLKQEDAVSSDPFDEVVSEDRPSFEAIAASVDVAGLEAAAVERPVSRETSAAAAEPVLEQQPVWSQPVAPEFVQSGRITSAAETPGAVAPSENPSENQAPPVDSDAQPKQQQQQRGGRRGAGS